MNRPVCLRDCRWRGSGPPARALRFLEEQRCGSRWMKLRMPANTMNISFGGVVEVMTDAPPGIKFRRVNEVEVDLMSMPREGPAVRKPCPAVLWERATGELLRVGCDRSSPQGCLRHSEDRGRRARAPKLRQQIERVHHIVSRHVVS